jgi:DnaJ-class molecular chaperone
MKPREEWPDAPIKSLEESMQSVDKESKVFTGNSITCPKCKGTGEFKEHICYKCFGTIYIAEKRE